MRSKEVVMQVKEAIIWHILPQMMNPNDFGEVQLYLHVLGYTTIKTLILYIAKTILVEKSTPKQIDNIL